MAESDTLEHNAPRPEDVLLDPIRQAIRSFVGSVEASSKEMTVAAERFALDSAQLIRTASTARHHTRRAAHQERDVADLQRSATAVTQAASQAAATAREAAGAANSSQGENYMSEADTIAATSRRLQRLEEDISILTGLLREVYDRVGSYPPPSQAPAASTPAVKTGPRRFRMRPPEHRLPRAMDQSSPPEPDRYLASDR
jgi:hypothetical protein